MEVLARTDKGQVREQNEDYFYISETESNPAIYMLADRNGTDMKVERLQVDLQ